MKRQLAIWVTLLATASMGLAACGGSSSDGLPSASTVTVSEWIVQPKPALVATGSVRITAKNVGSNQHEMLLYRGNAKDLPLKANGSVDEDAAEANIIGEISDIAAGTEKSKTFDLKSAGRYTLFCNIEQETTDGVVSHFVKGMVSGFTVSANK